MMRRSVRHVRVFACAACLMGWSVCDVDPTAAQQSSLLHAPLPGRLPESASGGWSSPIRGRSDGGGAAVGAPVRHRAGRLDPNGPALREFASVRPVTIETGPEGAAFLVEAGDQGPADTPPIRSLPPGAMPPTLAVPPPAGAEAWRGSPPMAGGYPGQAGAPPGPVSGGADLASTSWTYRPEPRLRTFQKNDIITIRVDEIARVLAQGDAQSRKNTLFRGTLTDWIRIASGRLRPDAQPEGDPSVGTQSNDTFRSQSLLESRESLTFNIAATVVDIRPNGNLVLEARKSYRVNDNLWETSLSGICRVQDIGPDNVVLSRDLIDLQIQKQDQGHLRDKYRRGWLTRLIDDWHPF